MVQVQLTGSSDPPRLIMHGQMATSTESKRRTREGPGREVRESRGKFESSRAAAMQTPLMPKGV